jgi:hypothetical protein
LAWTERFVASLVQGISDGDPVMTSHRAEIGSWAKTVGRWRSEDEERKRLVDEITQKVSTWHADYAEAERAKAEVEQAQADLERDAQAVVSLHTEVRESLAQAKSALAPLRDGVAYHLLPKPAQILPFRILKALQELEKLHGPACPTCRRARAALRRLPGGPYPPEVRNWRGFASSGTAPGPEGY